MSGRSNYQEYPQTGARAPNAVPPSSRSNTSPEKLAEHYNMQTAKHLSQLQQKNQMSEKNHQYGNDLQQNRMPSQTNDQFRNREPGKKNYDQSSSDFKYNPSEAEDRERSRNSYSNVSYNAEYSSSNFFPKTMAHKPFEEEKQDKSWNDTDVMQFVELKQVDKASLGKRKYEDDSLNDSPKPNSSSFAKKDQPDSAKKSPTNVRLESPFLQLLQSPDALIGLDRLLQTEQVKMFWGQLMSLFIQECVKNPRPLLDILVQAIKEVPELKTLIQLDDLIVEILQGIQLDQQQDKREYQKRNDKIVSPKITSEDEGDFYEPDRNLLSNPKERDQNPLMKLTVQEAAMQRQQQQQSREIMSRRDFGVRETHNRAEVTHPSLVSPSSQPSKKDSRDISPPVAVSGVRREGYFDLRLMEASVTEVFVSSANPVGEFEWIFQNKGNEPSPENLVLSQIGKKLSFPTLIIEKSILPGGFGSIICPFKVNPEAILDGNKFDVLFVLKSSTQDFVGEKMKLTIILEPESVSPVAPISSSMTKTMRNSGSIVEHERSTATKLLNHGTYRSNPTENNAKNNHVNLQKMNHYTGLITEDNASLQPKSTYLQRAPFDEELYPEQDKPAFHSGGSYSEPDKKPLHLELQFSLQKLCKEFPKISQITVESTLKRNGGNYRAAASELKQISGF